MKLQKKVASARGLRGVIRVPGDKSISHRALMLAALAEGTTEIEGFLASADCLHTEKCLSSLGISIKRESALTSMPLPAKAQRGEEKIYVEGQGLGGLQEPQEILDVGNSGTTMRLLSGILAGQSFASFLTGDLSLRKRPMGRVVIPLQKMGARIIGRQGGTLAPLAITGGNLKPMTYQMSVASAQVKSALLLAGLFTPGWTEVLEPTISRNHTELMLEAFGAQVERGESRVRVKGLSELTAQKVVVPGDLSSAAFLLVAGLVVPDSRVIIKSVGLNPTRSGIIDVLKAMGAKLRINEEQEIAGELRGTIEVESSSLAGVSIGGEIVPRLIDELPILAVAGLFARGVTEIRDAGELKVKESNRLTAICEGLTRLGGRVEELPDGLRIQGGASLRGAFCRSFGDHRIAMALAIAALGAEGETVIDDAEAVEVSFPGFWSLLDELRSENRC
ncbi:MAG: 3-phosphoshikimate 1-carboxyvinyltransferase [Clostridia bacterium]|nr:3-phosphoshikimate 1-carboxyvinyltransferase [Clostridia bacterium]